MDQRLDYKSFILAFNALQYLHCEEPYLAERFPPQTPDLEIAVQALPVVFFP